MIELSGYELSVLHAGEFTLYRGSGDGGFDLILLVEPHGEYTARAW
jgi:hypothetical protein